MWSSFTLSTSLRCPHESSNLYCCVPLCNQKENVGPQGNRVGFFSFPTDETFRKQWLLNIRRDVGPNFSITKHTRVCLLHFRKEEIKTGLGGKKMDLAKDAIPSKLAWRTSKRKRPPPFNRTSELIPEKRKRLEELCASKEGDNVDQNFSVSVASSVCTSATEGRLTCTADAVSNELDIAESQESLKVHLLQSQQETARLNE